MALHSIPTLDDVYSSMKSAGLNVPQADVSTDRLTTSSDGARTSDSKYDLSLLEAATQENATGSLPTTQITDKDGNKVSRTKEAVAVGIESVGFAIKDLQGLHDDACARMLEIFLNMLRRVINGIERLLDFLEGLKKEIDDTYEDFEDFPKLPDFDFPDGGLPDFDIIDLDCPFTKCLGLPPVPSIDTDAFFQLADQVRNGQGSFDDLVSKGKDYFSAMKQYGGSFSRALGANSEIALGNAKTFLENTPQGILNGLVDAGKAIAASFVNEGMVNAMDEIIRCLEAEDPRIAQTAEVIKYKELKQRVQFEKGVPKINKGKAESVINDFQSKIDGINNKLTDIVDMKANNINDISQGKLETTLPNKIKDKIDKFLPSDAMNEIKKGYVKPFESLTDVSSNPIDAITKIF